MRPSSRLPADGRAAQSALADMVDRNSNGATTMGNMVSNVLTAVKAC